MPGVAEVVTITNRELVFEVRDHYAEIGLPGLRQHFVLEPQGRDTAAAVGVAALEIARAHGGGHVMCVLPADHLIEDAAGFGAIAGQAIDMAARGHVVTLGIRPTRPETAYGYIEASGGEVVRFVEKPDSEHAEAFLASGRFLWNSGMFFAKAQTVIDLMQEHCPDILAGCRQALAGGARSQGSGFSQVEIRPDDFAAVRRQSIDYAVLEKATGLAVIPCDIGWSDVGSWTAFAQLTAADACGNTVQGEVVAIDTTNSYVRSENRLVATIGIDGLVVVDTPDALLVADAGRAGDVKQLTDMLKAAGHTAYRDHLQVHRPWGRYTVLETGPRFKIKRIEVKPGGRLSLQVHRHRSEHWVVVAGRAKVTNGEREMMLEPDQSTYIACGTRHRLENSGTEPLVLIEVQTGGYLGEDDIVRLDDVYGRPAS